eukprot:1542705-Prorocentrum_lima.AAC.1
MSSTLPGTISPEARAAAAPVASAIAASVGPAVPMASAAGTDVRTTTVLAAPVASAAGAKGP